MYLTFQISYTQENSEIKTKNVNSVNNDIECLINLDLSETIHTITIVIILLNSIGIKLLLYIF